MALGQHSLSPPSHTHHDLLMSESVHSRECKERKSESVQRQLFRARKKTDTDHRNRKCMMKLYEERWRGKHRAEGERGSARALPSGGG